MSDLEFIYEFLSLEDQKMFIDKVSCDIFNSKKCSLQVLCVYDTYITLSKLIDKLSIVDVISDKKEDMIFNQEIKYRYNLLSDEDQQMFIHKIEYNILSNKLK